MPNIDSQSILNKLKKKYDAQHKNVIELEKELEYCYNKLEDFKEKNEILNQNINHLRQQLEQLERELRKYKKINRVGDIQGLS